MKKILLIVLCFISFVSLSAQNTPSFNREASWIDSIISAAYPDSLPGISVLVARNDSILYQKAFGKADMELRVRNTPQNVFAIGSMTKQFTAVAMLKLVQEGKVLLTDDIRKYLPDYNTHGKKITIENLLTHTSGIPSYTEIKGFSEWYQKEMTPEAMIKTFQDSSLLFDPSSNWSYTNSGFLLAAYIIEKVSGQSFHSFLQDNLFTPARMNRTYFGSNEEIIPLRARGYDPIDSTHFQNTTYYSWSWPYGAGDILSCTGDLFKWYQALSSGTIVSKELLNKAWTAYRLSGDSSANYGYGWAVNDLNGHHILAHDGAIGGYLSDGIFVDDQKLYIVALTNSTLKDPYDITATILLRMLNLSTENPASLVIDPKKLSEYTGVYNQDREGSRLVGNYGGMKQYYYVTGEGGKLMLQSSGGRKTQLIPYATDLFYLNNLFTRIGFIRDKKKKIVAMHFSGYPVQYGPEDYAMKTGLPLPAEKKTIAVEPSILKNYCGTYEILPGFNMMILQDNDTLFAQATGQARIKLYAESQTKFFMKVVDAQIEFLKDSAGRVNSLLLTQGQQYRAKKISDETAASRKEISIDPEKLQPYCGTYELQPGIDIRIFLSGNKFYLQATGQDKAELFAESETKFFLKVVDAQVEFHRDASGNVTSLTLTQGKNYDCKKIN